MNIPFPLIVILWVIAGSLVIIVLLAVIGFIAAGYIIVKEGKSARKDYEARISLNRDCRNSRGRS